MPSRTIITMRLALMFLLSSAAAGPRGWLRWNGTYRRTSCQSTHSKWRHFVGHYNMKRMGKRGEEDATPELDEVSSLHTAMEATQVKGISKTSTRHWTITMMARGAISKPSGWIEPIIETDFQFFPIINIRPSSTSRIPGKRYCIPEQPKPHKPDELLRMLLYGI